MAWFAFRFHPLYRLLGAPFGITPETTGVEVAGGELRVRFGPWTLDTPLSNVAGVERSGPYSIPRTAGPAHLSFSDRGITCATNPDAGICLRFHDPVPGIDPLGAIRHPGLTLTLDRLDDFERAISGDPGSGSADDLPAHPAPVPPGRLVERAVARAARTAGALTRRVLPGSGGSR